MKDKLNIWDKRDMGGTNIIPISSLAYLMGIFNLSSIDHPGQLFITNVACVVIKNFLFIKINDNKKN